MDGIPNVNVLTKYIANDILVATIFSRFVKKDDERFGQLFYITYLC